MVVLSIIGITCIQSWNRFWFLVNAFVEIATICGQEVEESVVSVFLEILSVDIFIPSTATFFSQCIPIDTHVKVHTCMHVCRDVGWGKGGRRVLAPSTFDV